MADQWQDIRPSDNPSSVHVRRADPNHPLDLFRGRDHKGNYIFSFSGRFPRVDEVALPRLAILDTTLTYGQGGVAEFTIRLLDGSQLDVFRALCSDLLASTEGLGRQDDGAGIQIILGRLRKWQDLLRVRQERRLSAEEVIGLFGELLVLRDYFQKHLESEQAVAAWRGPHMDEQDFSFQQWLVEVKTQVASADGLVPISSERQLDSANGKLLLCHQTLGVDRQDNPAARTLNSLVEEVAEKLTARSAAARDRFFSSLFLLGYQVLSDYDQEAWTLHRRCFYSVVRGFPRISSTDLRPGVEGVHYCIRLESCEPFAMPEAEIERQVFSKNG